MSRFQDARYLIINADDFGMSHAANMAIMRLLEERAITSSTIMMPCPWAKEAAVFASERSEMNIGVHLTFTSEWNHYKWGPVTKGEPVDSLITDKGYFPQTSEEVENNASSDQVKNEIIQQIQLAKKMGINPTHLDNHMGSLYGLHFGKSFLPLVFEICAEHGLPFRFPRNIDDAHKQRLPFPDLMLKYVNETVALADRLGVVLIDYLLSHSFSLEDGEDYASFKKGIIQKLRNLKPGVSELYIHPALEVAELKGMHNQWQKRQMEYEIFRDRDVQNVLSAEEIRLISWRELRDVQRSKS